jgi:chromodomain-helicase-DNA-binding protein 4
VCIYISQWLINLCRFQEELDDIIRYGSKELFDDDNDEADKSRQIHYDDAAIDR